MAKCGLMRYKKSQTDSVCVFSWYLRLQLEAALTCLSAPADLSENDSDSLLSRKCWWFRKTELKTATRASVFSNVSQATEVSHRNCLNGGNVIHDGRIHIITNNISNVESLKIFSAHIFCLSGVMCAGPAARFTPGLVNMFYMLMSLSHSFILNNEEVNCLIIVYMIACQILLSQVVFKSVLLRLLFNFSWNFGTAVWSCCYDHFISYFVTF